MLVVRIEVFTASARSMAYAEVFVNEQDESSFLV